MLLIQNEVNAKRPVYFHSGNFTSFGHLPVTMVIIFRKVFFGRTLTMVQR